MGLLQFGLSNVLITVAIRRVTAIETVLILTLEPILNTSWVLIILGEAPGLWAIIGASVVLVGVSSGLKM